MALPWLQVQGCFFLGLGIGKVRTRGEVGNRTKHFRQRFQQASRACNLCKDISGSGIHCGFSRQWFSGSGWTCRDDIGRAVFCRHGARLRLPRPAGTGVGGEGPVEYPSLGVGINEGYYRGGFVGGAAGDGSLHAGLSRVAPAEIANVPRAVGQGGGVDAGDLFYVQEFHGAAGFGMATDAVGVEEETLCGIGDGVEDLFGLIGGGRGSGEGGGCGDAVALRDGQAGGGDRGVFAGDGVEIVGVWFGDYAGVGADRI